MIKWKIPSFELPEYGVPVLIWIDCQQCREGNGHNHSCISTPWNFPNSFQRGMYCKGMKDNAYAHKYPKDVQEDYWTPIKPSHWAYINSPFEKSHEK